MNSKDIYNSVCQVLSQSEYEGGKGTGFFFKDNDTIYFVSNKHVICGDNNNRTRLTFYLNIKDKNNEQVNINNGIVHINFANIIKSDIYDIAMYPVNNLFEHFNEKGYHIDQYILNKEDIETNYDKYDYIENVITASYPSDMKDSYTYRPIITGGITASPISMLLENKNTFLINITTYKGSSGSPIFIKKDGCYKMVGINYGSILREINIYDKTGSDNKQIKGETESYIATCVKSNIFLQLLKVQS